MALQAHFLSEATTVGSRRAGEEAHVLGTRGSKTLLRMGRGVQGRPPAPDPACNLAVPLCFPPILLPKSLDM